MFVIGDQSNQEQLHVLFTSDQPTPSGGEVPQPSDFEKKKKINLYGKSTICYISTGL
jgi:hypothetical protein